MARISELVKLKREDSLGFTGSIRIPFVGLYANSRASHYVSNSSLKKKIFFFPFTLSEGPGKPYFSPLPFPV